MTARRGLVTVGLLLALLVGCSDAEMERKCHLAVRSLVAAPEDRAAGELDKVVGFGRYALPDIEQEFHGAPAAGRRRLLDALDRLRLAEAQSFLEVVARSETDPALREQAAYLARRFRGRY